MEHDEELDIDKALVAIEQTKATLDQTYMRYQQNCPPEAKDAAECFANAATLFFGALTNLEEYTDSCEEKLLQLARTEADSASLELEKALNWADSVTDGERLGGFAT